MDKDKLSYGGSGVDDGYLFKIMESTKRFCEDEIQKREILWMT